MQRSIFALELCVRLVPGSPLRGRLHELVARHPEHSTYDAKWALYQALAKELRGNLEHAERGCWDFFDDDARAEKDFAMWCNGMLTEEGARREPSGVPDPYRGEPRFLTLTMALLLVQGSPSERAVRNLCHIPDGELWKRGTFARILDGLHVVNFASVIADVVYLIPGRDDFGLTHADLAEEKFAYLRGLDGGSSRP